MKDHAAANHASQAVGKLPPELADVLTPRIYLTFSSDSTGIWDAIFGP